MLLYGPYIKRANVAYKRHDDVIKELESLTGQRELRTNDYHHDLQRAITKTTELLEDSKDILDLNSFIINQRKESIPISPTEELFFNFNNADDENLMQTLCVNGNTYLITFLRENDTKLYKVNFEWKNPPKYWKYDFRIRLYYKDAEGIYIELTKDSVFISLTNRVATLETIDPSDLLLPSKSSGYVSPIKKLSNQPNEEFKNGNTLNAKKLIIPAQSTTTQSTLELKIEIEKIDYGFKQLMQAKFFDSIKQDMLEAINNSF